MSTETGQAAVPDTGFVSWREFLRNSYASSLALVCLAVWLHAADSLLVATMLPAIVKDIGGAAYVGWTVSLYEIGSIVAGAASALLTLRHGLRAPMCLAAALFGAGCALSAVSGTMGLLLVGRCLQGLGGGGLVAMAFVAVGVLFPRRYAARALAAISTLWGLSAFLGPLIGGVFVEVLTWRWGFWVFAAKACALALWIAFRVSLPADVKPAGAERFPLARLGLLCLAVVLVATGSVEIAMPRTLLFVVSGGICLAGFFALDARAGPDRLLPRRPLDPRDRPGAALLMIFAFSVATVALTVYGPLLMIAIHGVRPITAGYLVACSSIGWTVTAVAASGAPERLDRHLIAAGMGLIALSIVALVHAVPAGPLWLIGAVASLEGGGFGLAWTFVLRRATAGAAAGEASRIAGAIPTIQRLGYALGAAYIALVANASGFGAPGWQPHAAEIARAVFLASLPLAAIGLLAMVGLVRDGGR